MFIYAKGVSSFQMLMFETSFVFFLFFIFNFFSSQKILGTSEPKSWSIWRQFFWTKHYKQSCLYKKELKYFLTKINSVSNNYIYLFIRSLIQLPLENMDKKFHRRKEKKKTLLASAISISLRKRSNVAIFIDQWGLKTLTDKKYKLHSILLPLNLN